MKRNFLSFYPVLAAVVLFAGSVQAQPPEVIQPKFIAALNSMQVVPANDSTGRGSCNVKIYDPVYLDVNCEYSGLSSNLIGAYIHWGAAGENGMNVCQFNQLVGTMGTSGTFNLRCGLFYGIPLNPELPLRKSLYIDLHTGNFTHGEIRGQIKIVTLDSDVDGEGRTEVSVFRPSDAFSYAYCSMNDSLIAQQLDWHSEFDSTPFLADFDGDGIAERAFTRGNKLTGETTTIYTRNKDNILQQVQWGNALLSDKRALGDYDGDGKIDITVFRKSDGVWYILQSSNNQPRYEYWGQPDTDTPCPGDYDRDGKTDLCVVREENGQFAWYIRRSLDNQFYKILWGLSTDTFYPDNPVDIDGDGANDILVMRETGGQRYFYALRSSDNSLYAVQWGLSTDQVKIGDYDADGKTDFAAIREINNQLIWFIYESRNGQMRSFTWGLPGDK